MDIHGFNFEQDPDGRWYYIFPYYPGSRSDLEMVSGADDFLSFIAKGKDRVTLDISTDEDSKGLYTFKRVKDNLLNGADYVSDKGHKIWLCPVTLLALRQYYPKTLTIKRIV